MTYDLQGIFGRIERALAENPRTTLKEISQELQVDRHTLERSVYAAHRKSFREYQQEITLTAALRTLKSEPNLSIKQIAAILGYNSPRAFSRFIKCRTGRNPRDYRNSCSAS
ncbi:MAG: AraC family transcriptional regulator [Acidobacteria bacterium]|nr:AraC family transcriptional regulator [Acidobacteriota bacterium]